MSKAIQGAAMIAGAVGMGALAFLDPVLVTSPIYVDAMYGLALGGLSMEAGAIADALTTNRASTITTRTPASYRQIIYGERRVGGQIVYQSTTGSTKRQLNMVIAIAGHEVWQIRDLYLDGRQVIWIGGGSGWSVRNGVGFGGNPNYNNNTNPVDGSTYNFGGLMYCEARYGDQAAGDIMASLTANDPTWDARGGRIPDMLGCTYVYLKIEYDSSVFPGIPEARFTVCGKPVYDPRTSTTAYSCNWALIVNDILTDPVYGLGDASVNQAQLIAAANICDEQIYMAGDLGGYESRYCAHWAYDSSVAPGDALATIMAAAGGRLSRVGGEWYIYPAAYLGPAASFGADDLMGAVQWSEKRAFKDVFNRVRGTYTAPNYPFNQIISAYGTQPTAYDVMADFLSYGQTQPRYNFSYQATNFPQYAADVLHGYASDQYLTEDGGIERPQELSLAACTSVLQAQRVAKVMLLRNRQQGTGSLKMSLRAFSLMPTDTFHLTFAQNGWTDKLLEVNSFSFVMDDDNGVPKIGLQLGVNETDPSVYEWDPSEGQTVYDAPAAPGARSIVAPPTGMVLTSSAATALLAPDGTVTPRIKVTWTTPQDSLATAVQVQYQLTGDTIWADAGNVDVALNAAYISPVIAGQSYNVRIRTLRALGAVSAWEELDGFTAGLVLNVQGQDGVGVGSLVGEAYSAGTAAIDCMPFTELIGSTSLPIFPAGAVMLTTDGTIGGAGGALQQQTLYYVYFQDPTCVGGNVTPIATTNKADFLGKLGYFFIDSIITPYASSGGGGSPTRYAPSSYQDNGTRSTVAAASAYDGDVSTKATVSGQTTASTTSFGAGIYGDFPNVMPSAATTLTVVVEGMVFGSTGNINVIVDDGTTTTVLVNQNTNLAKGAVNVSIPAGTNLSLVTVSVSATPATVLVGTGGGGTAMTPATAKLLVYEIYIQ